MRGLIILANGFEDTEAITTIDILRRGGIDIVSTAYSINKEIVSQSKNSFSCDIVYKDINEKEYDFLILPGGKAVLQTLNESKEIEKLIMKFYETKKFIFAICAAPLLIGKLGLFDNLDYTCFPGCDILITKGNNTKENVVVNNMFITAKSMYYTIDFALAILEKLVSKDLKEKIERSIKGL